MLPMGIRDTSTPRLNNVIPMMITKALMKKSIRFHARQQAKE
jgi:hypothetical protein